MTQDKVRIGDQWEGLWAEVVTAAQAGTAAHEIEGTQATHDGPPAGL